MPNTRLGDGGPLTTLTRSEVLAARNGTNGSTPVEAPRTCESCGAPLADHQKRFCSTTCTRTRPGSRSRPKKSAKATPKAEPVNASKALSLGAALDAIPPDVTALEVAGWRCERRDDT
jgi:hypothetical protein